MTQSHRVIHSGDAYSSFVHIGKGQDILFNILSSCWVH